MGEFAKAKRKLKPFIYDHYKNERTYATCIGLALDQVGNRVALSKVSEDHQCLALIEP